MLKQLIDDEEIFCVHVWPKLLLEIQTPAVVPTANIVPVLLITAHSIVDGVIALLLHQLLAAKVDAELVAIYNFVVEAAKA